MEDVCYKRFQCRISALIRDKIDGSVVILEIRDDFSTVARNSIPSLLPPTAGRWKVVVTHRRGTGKWVPPERGCEDREDFKARSQRNVGGIPTASLKIGGDLFVHPICVLVEILSREDSPRCLRLWWMPGSVTLKQC